ncbi:thiamine biosynthesis protein ThiF [Shewanella algicola]|uniref:HesA/MoeB/ThiF family protein n=1 Tax=Shewanella algicola TaxID=640633 RepID=A0A9X1Z890_9GAMM|nr:HesA/MoeB/ThiF family protein [Shewanella algicola]MCL1107119.1 HesA/MoeB/ThiF family protein [Shewanella algicola]GGP41722.1 thiamine biosynthesis protein ThiF [Shewanella algicola]
MKSLTDREYQQYSRTMLLNDIGEAGQIAIMNSQVAIIGMGGLGLLVAQYLAAAGVKHLLFIDNDVVEISNLPRQLLYTPTDIGKPKVTVAKRTFSRIHSDIHIDAMNIKLTDDTIKANLQLITSKLADVDVVFDCTDNLPSRHVINQLCVQHQLILISGAISGYQGQVFCLNFADQTSVILSGCYHCLYPSHTHIEQNCTQQGVLGPAVGVIASMQALMGLQHISSTLNQYGVLHCFNAKSFLWQQAQMSRDHQCHVCKPMHISAQDQGAEYVTN